MRWVEAPNGGFELVSVPLHGYANKTSGEGEGVPIMTYRKPADPKQPWTTNTLAKQWHKTHNFDPDEEVIWVAAKEGIFRVAGKRPPMLIATNNVGGFGEVRVGHSRSKTLSMTFLAAIEPMHGTNLAIFTPPHVNEPGGATWHRRVLDSSLNDGHALACGDLLDIGRDQIIVGWRAMGKANTKVGIKLFTSLDKDLKEWRSTLIDDNGMACEDLCLADINGDGAIDIIAAGRGTKNVKIYFNELRK
jgi:hypothetical protein